MYQLLNLNKESYDWLMSLYDNYPNATRLAKDREQFSFALTSDMFLWFDFGNDFYIVMQCTEVKELCIAHFISFGQMPKLSVAKEIKRFFIDMLTNSNVERVTVTVLKDLQDSYHKMVQLVGFRYEGTLRKGLPSLGKLVDGDIYGLIRSDVLKQQEVA